MLSVIIMSYASQFFLNPVHFKIKVKIPQIVLQSLKGSWNVVLVFSKGLFVIVVVVVECICVLSFLLRSCERSHHKHKCLI